MTYIASLAPNPMRNRDLPIRSDAAANLIRQAAERAATPARPLPKLSLWRRIRLLICFAGLATVSVWLCLPHDSLLYLAGLLGILFGIAWWQAYRRRCPDCGHRLAPFAEDIYGSSQYRSLFRCSACGTVWDSGEVGDHNVDNASPS